jgi:hypothetical protein
MKYKMIHGPMTENAIANVALKFAILNAMKKEFKNSDLPAERHVEGMISIFDSHAATRYACAYLSISASHKHRDIELIQSEWTDEMKKMEPEEQISFDLCYQRYSEHFYNLTGRKPLPSSKPWPRIGRWRPNENRTNLQSRNQ